MTFVFIYSEHCLLFYFEFVLGLNAVFFMGVLMDRTSLLHLKFKNGTLFVYDLVLNLKR